MMKGKKNKSVPHMLCGHIHVSALHTRSQKNAMNFSLPHSSSLFTYKLKYYVAQCEIATNFLGRVVSMRQMFVKLYLALSHLSFKHSSCIVIKFDLYSHDLRNR